MISERLQSSIVATLKKELKFSCNIWSYMDQVILEISDDDFERNMGCLVQQMQHVIDSHFPYRAGNLFITVRSNDRRIENVIKIWEPFKTSKVRSLVL